MKVGRIEDSYIFLVVRASFVTMTLVMTGIPLPADTSGVLFYASMDGTGEAKSVGSGAATAVGGTPEFVKGRRGQAMRSSPKLGHFEYPTKDNILVKTGSIELWLCLDDWNTMTDAFFHVFFQCDNPTDWLVLYKYGEHNAIYWLCGLKEKYSIVGVFPDWKSGEWHHLVATWGPLGSQLFADGKRVGNSDTVLLPRSLGEKFTLGGVCWGGPMFGTNRNYGADIIDEVYIYGRALMPEEVEWAYKNTDTRIHGADVPPNLTERLRLQVKPFPSQKKCRLEVTMCGTNQPKDPTAVATIRFGKNTLRVPLAPFEFCSSATEFTVGEQPEGEFPVEVKVTQGSVNEVATAKGTLFWPGKPKWRGNTIGLEHTVPPPFVPLRINGNALSCWGRTYTMNKNGLPQQIRSQEEDLLAAPVEMSAIIGGQNVALERAELRTVRALPDVVQSRATAMLGNLRWTCDVTAEFDGFVRFDVALTPKTATTIESLSLRIPLRSERALYSYRYGATVESIPPSPKVVWQSPFVPLVWMGDEDRGVAWCCESDEPFFVKDPMQSLRMQQNGDAVDLIVQYGDMPLRLTKPWRTTFALLASPVRPRAADWRNYLLSGTGIKGAHGVWPLWPTPKVIKHYGYPEATDPLSLQKSIDEAHRNGVVVSPYLHPSMLSTGCKEWRQFGQEWGNPAIIDAYSTDVTAYGEALIGVSNAVSDQRDFWVWKNDAFMREFKTDGQYYDHSMFARHYNPLGGSGYLRDGKEIPTWEIFGKRELYKRLYRMARSHNKRTFIMGHTANTIALPLYSFCDAILFAEGVKALDSWFPPLTEPQLRIEYNAKALGPAPYWLFTNYNDWQKSEKGTEHAASLAMLYDVATWPSSWNQPLLRKYDTTLHNFGIVRAEHLPYWKLTEDVQGQTEAVKCSAYRLPEGGALLVVVNLSRMPQIADLKVNWSRFKSPGELTLEDSWRGSAITLTDGRLILEIEPHNFRLVRVR